MLHSSFSKTLRPCQIPSTDAAHKYDLLGYVEARKMIYVPAYKWVLENKCSDLVNKIRIIAQHKTVILLDYNTNEDIERASKPLSHASILKRYIEDTLV